MVATSCFGQFQPRCRFPTLNGTDSDQMHTLPRNSAEHTRFLFFASFRRSKSALHRLLCEATCSRRTDKQLGNNVTSVDEYSKIVTVQQLGDRIMHIMHISRLKYNS